MNILHVKSITITHILCVRCSFWRSTWISKFACLWLCFEQANWTRPRKKLGYEVNYSRCNTESHNAWRVHELIVGFFSRRELGQLLVKGTYFCCHTAACDKRMASKLIETLFIYSLASFYGLLASFAVLWQIIRRFGIPPRAKRRDTRKWINPILLSLILSEIVLRLLNSLLIGICQLES